MAVPGRKAEQHQSSGSATDYEHSCDACLVDGQDVEAHGYCFDCQDHLCVTCFRFHRKNRASRNHRLVDNTASLPAHVTKSSAETCTVTEKCAEHEGQILKFFCLKHEALACHDCVTLDHRRCDIDYIPKTCVGVTESKEYIDTFKKLNDLLEYVNYVQKMTEKKNCEIVNASTRVVEEIDKFQKDVNDRIYQLRCQILGKVASEKKKQNDDIGIVLKTCEKMASDIKQVITSSHENEAAQREGQIYIYMKRAEQIIKSQEIEKAKANLHAIPTEITFKRNREIENIFSHQVTFGTLKIPESTKPIKVKGVHKSASRNTNAFYFNNSRQSEFGDSEGSPSDEEEVDATYIPFKNPKESTKPIKVVGVGKSASRDTNAFYFNNSRQSEFGDSEGSPSDEKEEDATYIPFKNPKESTKPIKVVGVGKSASRDTNAFYFNNSRQSEFGDSEGSPSDEKEEDATYIPFKNQKESTKPIKVVGVGKSASRDTNAFYFNNSRQSEFGDSEGSPSDEKEEDATYIPFKNQKESTKPIKVEGVGKSTSRDTNAFYFNNSRQSEFGDSEGSPSDEEEVDATYIPFKNQKDTGRIVTEGYHYVGWN